MYNQYVALELFHVISGTLVANYLTKQNKNTEMRSAKIELKLHKRRKRYVRNHFDRGRDFDADWGSARMAGRQWGYLPSGGLGLIFLILIILLLAGRL